MRKGTNPAKLEDSKVENPCFHQVIVPVYLPKLEGYYKDGLDILKMCLESIYLTVHDKTFISVVNNGSCDEVKSYLDGMLKAAKIHEVIHTSSIGKINAIAKALSGHNFDLVTITDADVLFINGWQKAVYGIYEAFPKAGMVGTTPNSKMLRYLTENIHFDNLFLKNLKFRPVAQPEKMRKFSISIDNEKMFNEVSLNKILSLKRNEVIATLGTGHFTATYKKELLHSIRKSYDLFKISADSDRTYLDIPSIKKGHWRLCTYENYTFHLGNHVDDWAIELLKDLKSKSNQEISTQTKPDFKPHQNYSFSPFKQFLIKKLFFNSYTWRHYLKYLGLSRDEAMKF